MKKLEGYGIRIPICSREREWDKLVHTFLGCQGEIMPLSLSVGFGLITLGGVAHHLHGLGWWQVWAGVGW